MKKQQSTFTGDPETRFAIKAVVCYDFFNNFTGVIDRLGGKMTFVSNEN